MEVFKLIAVFGVLVFFISIKKPLVWAVAAAAASACLMFGITPSRALEVAAATITNYKTLSMMSVMYLVTLLERMLQRRDHINIAQTALSVIFNSRRLNASISPIFLGFLPTAGSILIAGDMVEACIGDDLSKEDKAASTSLFRHIPEAFMPTYASVFLALSISGIPVHKFLYGMIIPMVAFFFIVLFTFLRKVKTPPKKVSLAEKKEHAKKLFVSMWSIALIILLILVFKIEIYIACIAAIISYYFANSFRLSEIKPLFVSAWETNLMLSVVILMFFSGIITETRVINSLPQIFSRLPIPADIIFMLIFFFGTIVSGGQAIVAICMPLAYAALPDGGLPLLLLLMCSSYAAMQISPTHICLALISEHFHINMGALIKKIIPPIMLFMGFLLLYRQLLAGL